MSEKADIPPDLVARALAGEEVACRALVDALTPVFQQEAARALRHSGQSTGRNLRQEVTDLTQEIFLSLFERDARALREWRPDGGRGLLTYLRVFARYQAVSLMRTQRRNPYTERPTDLGAPEAAGLAGQDRDLERRLQDRDTVAALGRRVEREMSELDQRLFHDLFVAERSNEEIAADLAITPGVLYKRIHRLRERLKDLLGEDERRKLN